MGPAGSAILQVYISTSSYTARCAMLLLTGQNPPSANSKDTAEKRTKLNLYPHIQRFARLIGWNITRVEKIDQILTYESITMATNVVVNIKEHYSSKLKNFISRIFFRSRGNDETTRDVRTRVKRVQNYVLERSETPANRMTARERQFAARIIDRLDISQINVSVAYALKVNPLRVLLLLLIL